MDQKGNGRKKGKQANEADRQNSRVSELFPEVALVDRDVRMATGLGKSWAKSGSLVEKKRRIEPWKASHLMDVREVDIWEG